MIAVDTNILVYAHREDSPWHEKAVATLTDLAASRTHWAIAWSSIHEFIAIVTHPRIYRPPTPPNIALATVEAWLQNEELTLLHEGPGYFDQLAKLAQRAKIQGPRIHDARIAALCLHHGVSALWTADRDFSPFPELKIHNPLVSNR